MMCSQIQPDLPAFVLGGLEPGCRVPDSPLGSSAFREGAFFFSRGRARSQQRLHHVRPEEVKHGCARHQQQYPANHSTANTTGHRPLQEPPVGPQSEL